MTTITRAPATAPEATPPLDLDARMVLLNIEMDARLGRAAVAFEVNTAHIEGADPVPDIGEILPLTPTPTPATCPYSTPLAALLHRARVHLETHGWLRGQLRDDQAEKRCLVGAIRIEASNPNQADDACTLLLEAIQRDFRDAKSVPSWNDAQPSPRPVLLALDRAAQLAHNRNL
jgi:hypothetical protein